MLLALAAALLAATLAAAQEGSPVPPPPAPPPPQPMGVICLDPGHGGPDHGVGGALLEKDLTLAICRRMREALRSMGYTVYVTREGDFAVPIEDRTGTANYRQVQAFVSIHADSGTSATAPGPRVYSYAEPAVEERGAPTSPADWGRVSPLTRSEGAKLAQAIAAQLQEAGMPAAIVREAPLLVLKGARCPAALVEVGVLPAGESWLSRQQNQGRLAEAIARGIAAFIRPQSLRSPAAAPPAAAGAAP